MQDAFWTLGSIRQVNQRKLHYAMGQSNLTNFRIYNSIFNDGISDVPMFFLILSVADVVGEELI